MPMLTKVEMKPTVAVSPAAAEVKGTGCDGLTLTATRSTPWVGNAGFGFNVGGVQQIVSFVGWVVSAVACGVWRPG